MSDQSPSRADLEDALRNAAAAGNTDAATKLADALAGMGTGADEGWRGAAGIGALLPMEMRHTDDPTKQAIADKEFRLAVPPVIKGIPGALKSAWEDISYPGDVLTGRKKFDTEEANSAARGIVGLTVGTPAAAPVAAGMARGVVEGADLAADAARAAKPLPKIESADLRAQSRGNYDILKNSGVRITPESFQEFADSLPSTLDAYSAKHPGLTPKASQVLTDFKGFAADDADTLSLAEIERSRQAINKSASGTRDAHDALVLGDINDKLEDYVTNLKDDHLDAGDIGDVAEANAVKLKARELWKRNAQVKRIEDVQDIAQNLDNKDLYVRQRFTAFLKNPRVMAQYTPKQRVLIKQIANQGTLGQLGRIAPRLTPAGMVKGAVYGGASAAGLGLPAALLAGASTAAVHGAEALRGARVNDLLTDVSRGGNTPSFLERFQAERGLRKSVQDMDTP